MFENDPNKMFESGETAGAGTPSEDQPAAFGEQSPSETAFSSQESGGHASAWTAPPCQNGPDRQAPPPQDQPPVWQYPGGVQQEEDQPGEYHSGNVPDPSGYGQQTQWTFNDYGPLGGPGGRKKEKKPRPAKNPGEKKPGQGIKVLAIVMSVLFVCTAAGLGGYIVYDLSREEAEPLLPPENTSSYSLQTPPSIEENQQPAAPVPDGAALSPKALYQAVEPAVVGVVGYIRSNTGVNQPASQGSGVVFDSNGYIVTNWHVIQNEFTDQSYEKIDVIFTTGETYSAQVLGSDKETDLAVLKVEASGLKTAVFGDSDQLQVGDDTFVIGNPSGIKYAGSMSRGIISALNREVYVRDIGAMELIQTDAAINPGNSGGALVNSYGRVIGITSAKMMGEDYEGMGFAIPINGVKPIVESLINNGYVTGRVQIGLYYTVIEKTIADLNGIPQGLRVVSFFDDSDAQRQGLLPGDIIYRMDGVEVKDTPDVKNALLNKNPGDKLVLSVYRVDANDRAERLEITITLMEKIADQ